MQRTVIVGSGHLAQALWEGWQGLDVGVLARSDTHRPLWDPRVWAEVVSFDPNVIRTAHSVVLAVKPKDVEETLGHLLPYLDSTTLIISPVAGWSTERIRSLGVVGPVVRVMPNICAAVGASTTLVALSSAVSEAAANQTMALFSACGTVTLVKESLMDPYTALVGSGPAYIFMLLEALIDGGTQLGADRAGTRQLVSLMVEGAARLARLRPDDRLSDWMASVASPGGTTEALLTVLRQHEWPEMIQEAVVAASTRAEQLGQAR